MVDDDTPAAPSGTSVQSVSRALALLQCFGEGQESLSLTEMAGRTRLSVSTAHRLLRTLTQSGMLVQDRDTERYSTGPALVRLGRVAFASAGLSEGLETLHDLVEATGESASLGIREADEVVVVLRVESTEALRFIRPPGTRVPLHVSAMGKALLAFGPTPIAESVAALEPLARFTPATLTKARALVRDLQASYARGYTLCDEEHYVGVRSLGVPVLGPTATARAAIAIQAPAARLDDARLEKLAETLRGASVALATVLRLDRLR